MAEPGMTPLPWRCSSKSSGTIVADSCPDGADMSGRAEPETIAYYGGVIVCESMRTVDREYAVRAANEYEALRALEAEVRGAFRPDAIPLRFELALANLDAARSAT